MTASYESKNFRNWLRSALILNEPDDVAPEIADQIFALVAASLRRDPRWTATTAVELVDLTLRDALLDTTDLLATFANECRDYDAENSDD